MSVVVCCRFNEYTELPARLSLNGALRLRTLSRDQVAVQSQEGREPSGALAVALAARFVAPGSGETPFWLSMMIRTYQDLRPGAIDSVQFATVEARKRQLLDAYVQRQFPVAFQGGTSG